MSVIEQLSGAMAADSGRDVKRSSLTLAKVTNIRDEKNLNRVKCLPIGGANDEETDWCYVMAPMGGKESGMCFFPQVNDLVVLAYLGDDPHRPLVLGSFWNSELPPPCPIKDGKVEDYAIKTPKKIELLFHDEDKKQRVTLTMPSGAVLTIDDGGEKVEVKDKGGENSFSLDWKGGNVTLKAKSKLSLAAGQTAFTIESGGNITLKGNGTIKLQGTGVEAKASGKLAMQGATAEVKADGTLQLSASGPATLKRAMVKIN